MKIRWFRRTVLVLGLLCGLGFAAGPVQAQTVEEYLQIERGEMPNVSPQLNLPLLLGVMEGLAAFSDAALINDVRFFCVPSKTAVLNFDEFKKKFDRMLYELERDRKDFPEYASQTSIGTIGLRVLIQAYPCIAQDEQAAQ